MKRSNMLAVRPTSVTNNRAQLLFKGETRLFQIPNRELRQQARRAPAKTCRAKANYYRMTWCKHQADRLKQRADLERRKATPRIAWQHTEAFLETNTMTKWVCHIWLMAEIRIWVDNSNSHSNSFSSHQQEAPLLPRTDKNSCREVDLRAKVTRQQRFTTEEWFEWFDSQSKWHEKCLNM